MNDQFVFTAKLKQISIGLMGLGLVGLLLGFLMTGGHHEAEEGHHAVGPLARIWSLLLLNNVYFTGIALAAVFFVAVSSVTEAGWSVVIKRVPEAIMSVLPYLFIPMLLTIWLGGHDLYHWMHEGLTDPESANYDKIIAGKSGYLNFGFFLLRTVLYFALWTVMARLIRRNSLQEDAEGGLIYFKRNGIYSPIFIVIFAITSCTAAWDWMMSVDPHWYSTIYGWYFFAGTFTTAVAAVTLIVVLLKKYGYLPQVTEEHLHDLGKLIFAFSFLWGYMWFCQFMLIWYANIPEETVYFNERFEHHKVIFFVNLVVNFAFPFLVLMTRDSKRKMNVLILVCSVVLIGHWLDFFLMIMTGTLKGAATIGLTEIFVSLGYVGGFIFVTLTALSKASLTPKNHPFLEESLHHHT